MPRETLDVAPITEREKRNGKQWSRGRDGGRGPWPGLFGWMVGADEQKKPKKREWTGKTLEFLTTLGYTITTDWFAAM